MKSKINKEKWISDVMSSIHNIQPASPPIDLFRKITIRINTTEKVRVIALPAKQWAAAAILLLTLNIGSAIYAIGQNKKTANTSSVIPLAAEMQLESTYNY